ncbi:MAG: diphosphate--fructose-6-phosphate 1-phosphotransferase, partial [Spirochaetia bacterium]|nr:diphosphate--fructose-6-phosphate 1-phosphotransferase [Spirochaetia bacterium]
MSENILIIHGGAPTAVMNASLYGVVKEARESKLFDHIYAAKGGAEAVLQERFVDLSQITEEVLQQLPHTPASWIGTSRFHISEQNYHKMVEVLLKYEITAVLFNGGNGSMDACGKLARAIVDHPIAKKRDIKVVGIPKTMDNDLAVTDHSPGFGSAARYLAASVAELSQDLASLPIHVCVLECMGRNAGWLTASAALAKTEETLGPHLIYVPEVPFHEEKFLDEAKSLYERYGGVLVVASEGLKNEQGKPIVEPIFEVGRSVYYGDVSSHLANLVIKRLGIKARSEKPGILGRCSIAFQSETDREEAILVGREAVKAVLNNKSQVMVGLRRLGDKPYLVEPFLIPLEQVMLHERTLPLSYLK